jgi:hypothetical protein
LPIRWWLDQELKFTMKYVYQYSFAIHENLSLLYHAGDSKHQSVHDRRSLTQSAIQE